MRKYIIARYLEDLTWLRSLPQSELIIYNKGPTLATYNNVIDLPNVGRESHTYLTYIVSNYSNLPNIMIFAQGRINDHTPATPIVTSNADADYLIKLGNQAEVSVFGISDNFCNTGIYLDWNIKQEKDLKTTYQVNEPSKISFGDWFNENFIMDYPARNCKIAYGSIFAIRRDMVLSRPKSFYAALLDQCSYENAPIEAHFLERSWYYIPLHHIPNITFYAICLKTKRDRVEKVDMIKTYMPQLQILKACNAAKFAPDFIDKLKENGFFSTRGDKYVDCFKRPYQTGAVGCFLSHKMVLEQFSSSHTTKYAVIFEDDVILLPYFNENLNNIINMICDYEKKNGEIDIVNLYLHRDQKHFYKTATTPQLLKAPIGLIGTQCYLVKKSTVQNVINTLNTFENPIDEQLSRSNLNYIHLVGQDIVDSGDIPSYIQNKSLSRVF